MLRVTIDKDGERGKVPIRWLRHCDGTEELAASPASARSPRGGSASNESWKPTRKPNLKSAEEKAKERVQMGQQSCRKSGMKDSDSSSSSTNSTTSKSAGELLSAMGNLSQFSDEAHDYDMRDQKGKMKKRKEQAKFEDEQTVFEDGLAAMFDADMTNLTKVPLVEL